jgi:hypothetical protein
MPPDAKPRAVFPGRGGQVEVVAPTNLMPVYGLIP